MRLVIRNVLLSVFLTLGLASCSGGPDKTPAQAILDAVAALDARKPAVAIIELKNAIQVHPRDPYLRAQLAEVFLAIGDGVSAEIEAEKAGGYGFDSSKTLLLTARAVLRQRRYEKALQILDDAGILDSKEFESERQLLLAKTHLAGGLLDAAGAALARANSQAPEARVTAAKLMAARGDKVGAISSLSKILGQFETYAPGWSLLGDVQRYEGDNTSALAAYDEAVKFGLDNRMDRWHRALLNLVEGDNNAVLADVKVLRGRDMEQPQAAFLEGVVKVQQGKYAAAQPLLQVAADKMPDYRTATYFLALTNFHLKEHESAERMLSGYVSAEPHNLQARQIRALNLWQLGQREQAAEEARAVLELDGGNAFALELLSLHALGRGQGGEAVAVLEKMATVGVEGDVMDLRLGLGYLMAGERDKGVAALENVSQSSGDVGASADNALIFQALKEKDYDHALWLIDGLQHKLPGEARPHALRGTALAEKGDLAGAQKAFERAWSIAPGDVTTGRSLARLALKNGDVEQAEKYYGTILMKNPESAMARLELAQLLLARKDFDGFVKQLELATRDSPDDPRPWLFLLQYDLAIGSTERAIQRLNQMPNALKKTVAVTETAGLVYMRIGQGSRAERVFSRLAQQFPEISQFRFWLAESQGMQQKITEARSTLELARIDFPDDLNALIALANLEIDQGDFDKAETLIGQIGPDENKSLATASLIAKLAYAQKDYTKAAKALERIVAVKPTRLDVYRLVNAVKASGQSGKAIALGESWVERDAENIPLYLLLAEFYQEGGEREKTIHRYESILEIQPGNPIANNNLAGLLMESDPVGALAYARKSYEAAPESDEIADTYGWALHLNGRSKEAEAVLTQAYRDGKGSHQAGEHLNAVRRAMGGE